MCVIAKVAVRKVYPYGTGNLVELGCVAANETMLFSSPSEEDRLFTQASPSGEIRLSQPQGYLLGDNPKPVDYYGTQFYVIVLLGSEADAARAAGFPGAWAWTRARLNSITDMGGITRYVEFTDNNPRDQAAKGVDRMNWKMGVDNPGAYRQLKAGDGEMWVGFYPCAEFTYERALATALAGVVAPKEA